MPVSLTVDNFYARWRTQRIATQALREDTPPPERLLQAIWQHQRVRRDQLATLDGQVMRVLHPGFMNLEGGPDFRGAVIQIGSEPPRTGDVEVDVRASGWHAHGHDRNPSFNNVILHVLWDVEKTLSLPTLALRPVLDAPLSELNLWLEHEPAKSFPESLRGKCCSPLGRLNAEQTELLLREAAQVRLQTKVAQLQARARHAGWEQALWEGLFRALGYKHNVWPMHALAENRARWGRRPANALILQARSLGLSGLLPTEPGRTKSAADKYLRRVWDCWWRERDEFGELTLPRSVWRLHGLRPANHPQRRLALAAHWLANGSLSSRLEQWCASAITDRALLSSLEENLAVEIDEFWSWHWTLRSTRLAKPQALLGAGRVTDLAVNVILPWLWTRACEGSNLKLQREIERRYFAWPASEDNSILRLARQRLLSGRRFPLNNAAMQQGLLQIVRDFCDHSNAICEDCRFPELVTEWLRKG
jgi:hypothetical protein